MQAKLPDVNAAIVRYRSKALDAVTESDYALAVISLSAINADLPEDYKVKVSTERYNEIMKDRKSILCEFCTSPEIIIKDGISVNTGEFIPTECVLSDVKQYDLELSVLEKVLLCKNSQRVWICTKCEKLNKMDIRKIKIRRYEEPFYLGIMPSPPIPEGGIRGRNTYDAVFKKWFAIALNEIESKIGLYRAEYAAQQESEEIQQFED